MFDDHETAPYLLRLIGALLGVLVSLVMVAPEGTKAAFYRVLVGVTMGVIFAPVMGSLPLLSFLAGETTDLIIARSAAAGFSVWFILEAIARLMSSTDWIVKTAKAIIELRNTGEGK
jgi:hypothetical protein